MTREITVFYAHSSPWTYLGWQRMRDILERTGASATFRPIFMAPVFQASGGLPLGQRPKQRQAYRLMELERWRKRLDVDINLHPKFFPVDDRLAARVAIAHDLEGGDVAKLSQAIMRAVWEEERDIADGGTLEALAGEQGLDGRALIQAAEGPEVERRYDQNTELAIEVGVFGVPTFQIGDELFWGQDRLDFVEEALRQSG
ncbi:MAG: 2-hydroxychromene-2-carboxylate isomerase [Geminicoccaceae bacterium]|nr:2-hydroxychromene-2-carboxylate isomerase [Geminicoccaceae bacterium]